METVRSSEAGLLDRACRGDDDASGRLLQLFDPTVRRIVRNRLRRDPDYEDVVQDVIMKITAHLRTVREPERLVHWVATVAFNTVAKELRRRGVQARRQRAFERETDASAGVGGEGALAERDLLRRLQGAIDRLPEEQRAAFWSRYVEQLSIRDVARACRCSPATVKRRLAHARARLLAAAAGDAAVAAWLAPRS